MNRKTYLSLFTPEMLSNTFLKGDHEHDLNFLDFNKDIIICLRKSGTNVFYAKTKDRKFPVTLNRAKFIQDQKDITYYVLGSNEEFYLLSKGEITQIGRKEANSIRETQTTEYMLNLNYRYNKYKYACLTSVIDRNALLSEYFTEEEAKVILKEEYSNLSDILHG